MCNGSDNPPDTMTTRRQRARIEHRCVECDLPIPPGTTYVHTWGVWDDEPATYKQHAECRALLDYISAVYCGGEFWSFSTLRDELSEYTDFDRGGYYWGTALSCRMAAIEARYDR